MPYITEIKADDALNAAAQHFATTCDTNKVVLGLTVPDLAEIAGAAVAFGTSLTTLADAKALAEGARESKDVQRTATKAIISKWAKTFRANPAVPDGLLTTLQVAPHIPSGVKTPPTVPLGLDVMSDGNGNIKITWKRNGNIRNTQFIIQYRTGPAEPWVQLGTSLKRTFDTTWTPGVYVAYRVIATRRGLSSPASNAYVMWDGESEVTLKLAA